MEHSRIQLPPGTLWPALLERSQSALASGALRPIETVRENLVDAGVDFVVRKVSSLERKARSRRREAPSNPFLPYEPALFVADVSDSHVALLNKYNVLEHHLLVVTRAYAEQESLLDAADFAALAACMREFDSLGFYNGGREAGASEPHKHLQLVPLPLERGRTALPIEALLEPLRGVQGVCRLPTLPFQHVFSWIDPASFDDPAGAELQALYVRMLSAAGLTGVETTEGVRQSGPYNLLLTRLWMMLVPRSRECFGPVSVNALGFAGSMFVRGDAQMEVLRQAGPMKVLAAVARTPESATAA